MIEKCELRNLKKRELQGLSADERTLKSRDISARVLRFLDGRSFSSVCIYNSFSTEVQTDELIGELLKKGYNVLLPRIKEKGMDVIRIDENTNYFVNEFGISEPEGKGCDEKAELIIMPLLAFDRNYNRLGRGKGYYDEFLKTQDGVRLAIAFACQEAECVPVEELDEKLDVIITEKETLER